MSHGNGSSQGKRQKKQLSNNEKYMKSVFVAVMAVTLFPVPSVPW